ncbi:MAG: methylenetetrahydrofolate reductase C-terminal domain-containing protein [Candidatus Omnitrophota bacterium]
MAKKLLDKEISVLGMAVLDPACSAVEVKRFYRKEQALIDNADVILSFACGGGTQIIAAKVTEKQVLPGNDTLFQGAIIEANLKQIKFSQKCSLCGECLLSQTAGICPVTSCAKGLVNGPCGGTKRGKCEIDKDMDCAWLEIYDRLKQRGRLSDMKKICGPRDYTKNKKPQRLIAR